VDVVVSVEATELAELEGAFWTMTTGWRGALVDMIIFFGYSLTGERKPLMSQLRLAACFDAGSRQQVRRRSLSNHSQAG